MTEFYDDMAGTAGDLIAEFGQAVTLTHSAPGTYDTATGTTSDPTVTTQACRGVEEFYSAPSITGTLIQAGDKKLLLSPLNEAGAAITPPVAEDTITFADGVVWTVKDPGPLSPGGTPVMFTLQLRKS